MISVLIAAAEGGEEAPNFLLPNATFLVELGIFALLVFVLAKWVIPPINKAMTDRQAAIKAQFDALAQIDVERAQTLAQLKSEVGSIATTLAGRIVGESLDDDERQKRTVDRFIADLESSN